MTGLGWFAAIIVGGLPGWNRGKNHESPIMGLIMEHYSGSFGALCRQLPACFAIVGATLGGWDRSTVVGIIGACLADLGNTFVRGT